VKEPREEPKYSFSTAKQLIFDCIIELQYHTENFSDDLIAGKLNDILHQLDLIDEKLEYEKQNLYSAIDNLNNELEKQVYSAWGDL